MGKNIPLRKCIACGEMKDKREMIRVVTTKEGEVFIDETGKKNGRGAYVCGTAECFNLMKKKHSLERTLKNADKAEEIIEKLRQEIEEQ